MEVIQPLRKCVGELMVSDVYSAVYCMRITNNGMYNNDVASATGL